MKDIQKNPLIYNEEKINIILNNSDLINKNKCDNQSNVQNKKKIRNPGIDLMRLIGMYIIVMNHMIFIGNAFKKFNKYYRQLNILHILTDWHNNGFALLSGVVGYKSHKYSNLFYLWITVLFYSVGIHIFIKNFKKQFIIKADISREFCPIVYRIYWYFTSYFGMYLYLPIINKGISCLTKYEFQLVIISTLGIFVLWKDLKNPNQDIFNMNKGGSMVWLLTFYLTGAYIGKYRVSYSGLKKYVYCFLYIFIYFFSSYLYIKVENNSLYLGNFYVSKKIIIYLKKMLSMKYDSFLKISQSITACLFFLQINYSKPIAKAICFLGPLSFGIYLIHIHPLMFSNVLRHIFDKDLNNINLYSTIILILIKASKMFFFCLIIDYFRNLLFYFLRIKKLCIFFETMIINN